MFPLLWEFIVTIQSWNTWQRIKRCCVLVVFRYRSWRHFSLNDRSLWHFPHYSRLFWWIRPWNKTGFNITEYNENSNHGPARPRSNATKKSPPSYVTVPLRPKDGRHIGPYLTPLLPGPGEIHPTIGPTFHKKLRYRFLAQHWIKKRFFACGFQIRHENL